VSGSALPELLAIAPVGALALAGELVPTAGTWERSGAGARFTPRFPVVGGTAFAVLGRRGTADDWRELARLVAPAESHAATTVVESIDPRVEEIPANLLRFAITFSAPMEEGSAAGRVHLLDAEGRELTGALFGMPPELWDRERRRLTVLLEPGRIKRGLQPNVQAGPPLREDDTVTLAVDAGIRDATGAELVALAERSFRVGAPVRALVDPSRWDVRWPRNERDELVIRFERPLDPVLARRCIRVVDGGGRPVPGRVTIDESSMVWTFHADAGVPGSGSADVAADRVIRIDTRLEDFAGNSVRRVFDRDLGRPEDDGIEATSVEVRREGGMEHRA
jgi:hypothetical protein